MAWHDDYYLGSSDYPLAGDDEQAEDPYFDPWVAAYISIDDVEVAQ